MPRSEVRGTAGWHSNRSDISESDHPWKGNVAIYHPGSRPRVRSFSLDMPARADLATIVSPNYPVRVEKPLIATQRILIDHP